VAVLLARRIVSLALDLGIAIAVTAVTMFQIMLVQAVLSNVPHVILLQLANPAPYGIIFNPQVVRPAAQVA